MEIDIESLVISHPELVSGSVFLYFFACTSNAIPRLLYHNQHLGLHILYFPLCEESTMEQTNTVKKEQVSEGALDAP